LPSVVCNEANPRSPELSAAERTEVGKVARDLLHYQKCSALFEHVCESNPGRDTGVHAEAG